MNLLALVPLRFWLYGALMAALTLGAWRLHHVIDQQGYERAKAECVAAVEKANKLAQAQRDEQAANAAAASAGYENARITWDQTLKATKHDLYAATQNLASCRLNSDSVRLLNDAGRDSAQSP